ncbi:MAG TPA: hypothetical protein VJ818_04285 [Actinomycetota bacterium]|nr:hypothetical protein [Actinomycetota bacterium]
MAKTMTPTGLLDPGVQWDGETRPYDLVREFVIALTVVSLLTVLLAVLFSSPDERPVTIQSWSQADPADFVTTAVAELDGSSDVAGYGAPYNNTAGAAQKIGPVSLQQLAGVRIPIDTAKTFVLDPLHVRALTEPPLAAALTAYEGSTSTQRSSWTDAYSKALDKATFSTDAVTIPAGAYGPVPIMMSDLLSMAQSGALDGVLVSTKQFYQTDYTKPLLFISDGSYLGRLAQKEHLLGSQWGMMNETGSYPGQAWLWLYTMWYQIPPFNSSGNADALIWAMMLVLTAGLIFLPFIPGLRAIPEKTKVYRLIWRDYYRRAERRS